MIDVLKEIAEGEGDLTRRLKDDTAYIDSVLADGSTRAQALAAETMKAVKDIVGFVRRP